MQNGNIFYWHRMKSLLLFGKPVMASTLSGRKTVLDSFYMPNIIYGCVLQLLEDNLDRCYNL